MRIMAGLAALHTNRFVLVDERAALFRVALQARLFVREGLIEHAGTGSHTPGGSEGAVGIVAISTSHEAFVDAMLKRHGELAANVGVAAVTKISLALRQQKFRNRRFVDGVAIGADHVVEGMGGAADVGTAQGFGVAAEAIVQNLLGLELGKSHDGSFAAVRLDVGLTRAVTCLASGTFGRFLTGGDALIVRILVKISPNVRVAGAAHVAPDEARRSSRRLLSLEQQQPAEK